MPAFFSKQLEILVGRVAPVKNKFSSESNSYVKNINLNQVYREAIDSNFSNGN